jgi:hypothetical protein
MRAGFGSRIIFHILKTWDVDDDTIAALETEPIESPEPQEQS